MFDSGRFFLGTLLLLIGVLWLLSNLGLLTPAFWDNLITLWPLLLIAFGLRLIFRRGFLALLSPLVLIIMIVLALSMPGEYYADGETGSFKRALEDSVTQARLVLDVGIVDLRVRASEPGSADLLSATERLFGSRMEWSYKLDGTEAVVRGSRDSGSFFRFSRNNFRSGSNRVEIYLNEAVPWSIELNTGASEASLDLTEIAVTRLNVKCGMSKVNIELGARADRANVEISAGFASVDLTIPHGVGVKIDTDMSLSGNNFRAAGFQRRDGVWLSPNYDTASKFIDIELDGGFSSFNVYFTGPRTVSL